MESKRSVRNLAESIHSLLGLKKQLTSTWAASVCNIIKDLSSEEPFNSSNKIKCMNFNSSENKDSDVDSVISKIQGDLAALNAQLNQLNIQRRQALNDFLDLKGNIRVFCRIRPLIEEEKFGDLRSVVALDSSKVLLKLAENKSKQYSFDKVFDPGSSQDEVFSEVEPVIKSAVDGYNACIFAYGQTGTGKTFTMEGTHDCPGVVPRAIEELFKQAADSNHTFIITFSMLEIYMGNLRDLLVPQMTKPTDAMTQCLSIQTDPKGGIEIENLVEIRVGDFNQAKKLYGLGSRFRSTASTNSNVTSSRSHCLIRISLTSSDATERRRERNKIWMVDLGGSERVLKTKAWGRRFEEGKAINLSLSALGDVINALQRRRSHVPFRNSKLTQVLKDSLGEDSRTLMLVHVSPKEEDLCETLCSLGFATRVRSIHLGSEESTDTRAKKEVAMAKLLEKVKQLECDRQDVRKDIKKLNEGLEHHLSKTKPSSDEHLEAPHSVSECNIKIEKKNAKDVTVAPSSQLPTFMRPTICSRRKSGIDFPTTKNSHKKISLPTRKRKPLSIRAESLTFPLKEISEYGSECSIARTTCLADYETEYSQNASECDIKMIVLPEQEKSQMSFGHSTRSKAQASHISTEGYANKKTNKVGFPKYFTVENWLQLQKNEPTTCSYTRGGKRVLAIPLPENKIRYNVQNKADILHNEEICNYDFAKKKSYNHDKINKLANTGVTGGSIMEMVIGDDFVIGNAGSKPNSPYEKVKGMDETPGSLDDFVINEDRCSPIPPPDMRCDGFIQNKDFPWATESERFIEQASPDKQNLPESFLINDSWYNPLSSSDMSQNNTVDLNAVSHVSVSKCELELEYLSCNTKTLSEECEKKDLCGFPLHMVGESRETRLCLNTVTSRRALFLDLKDANQDDLTLPFIESEEKICNTGILYFLGQKVQILCASALLGLGVQKLGLGHDFFYGLML
ncbi:Kinesin [Macleaya cordata]|uniref:Kinesin n=1 Tax=Macleaya cordata TaxID=56857 RepID=A0A200Q0B0_MACCD|nr:Kinesin [Macleaya cordata]